MVSGHRTQHWTDGAVLAGYWCPSYPAADGRKMSGKLKQNPAESAPWGQKHQRSILGQKMGILDRLCPRCPLLHSHLWTDAPTITMQVSLFFHIGCLFSGWALVILQSQVFSISQNSVFTGLVENCWLRISFSFCQAGRQHLGRHGALKLSIVKIWSHQKVA